MYKQLIICTLYMVMCVFPYISHASIIDAPHDESHGVSCNDCHSYSGWWQYSPASNEPGYETITRDICLKCHGPGGSAVHMVNHSSSNIGTSHRLELGDWSSNCVTCHDPHMQAQLEWSGKVNDSELYLVLGTIGPAGSFTNGNNTTSFSYNFSYADSKWSNPASWSKKNFSERGLIFVPNIINKKQTFEIIDANDGAITLKGELNADAAGLTFGIIYGQMIRSSIDTPASGSRDVKFFNPGTSSNGLVDDNTPSPTGVCQVCHTKTRYWENDGQWVEHTTTADLYCTSCHSPSLGFGRKINDTTAPKILTAWPCGGITVGTNGGSLTLIVTFVDDMSGIDIPNVKLINNNNNSQDITSFADFDGNTITYTLDNPVDDDYSYQLQLVDNAGNQANKNINFTVDSTVPVTELSFSGGHYAGIIVITVTCSQDAKIYYSTDGYPPFTEGVANTKMIDLTGEVKTGFIEISESTALQFFAEDEAFNREETRREVFFV